MRDAKEVLDLRPDGWTASPFFDVAKLAEEVGEVAECMIKSAKTKEDLGEELSDTMLVIAMIAVREGINLNEVYPKKRVKGIKKLLDRFHNGAYPSHVRRG